MVESRYEWIRTRLAAKKLKARDLAKAWGISESSTSRFLGGEESQDLPLSRACTLANLIGLSLDELAKGMGFWGKQIIPTTIAPPPPSEIPGNTIELKVLGGGMVRLTFSQDLLSEKAAKVMQILAQ